MRSITLKLIIEDVTDFEDLADLDVDKCIVCQQEIRGLDVYIIASPIERLPVHKRCFKELVNMINEWNNLYADY